MDIDATLKAFEQVTAPGSQTHAAWVAPYQPNKDTEGLHQFLVFLKPEATAPGVKTREILELVVKSFAANNIKIGAVRVLGGDYLEKHNLMVEHYGVISKISKEGVSAISEQAKEKLDADFKDVISAGAKVLGGNQFLKEQPQFNAFSLLTLNDNIGTKRLAGGTYAMSLKVLGKPYIILNPFHAYQLVPYTTSGNAIIALEALSSTSWDDLRNKVCGVTNPADAVPGSLRNLLLVQKAELGLGDVDRGNNGVHMSAGPLEGMVELRRFFSDHETGAKVTSDQTAFGSLLLHVGVSAERVEELAQNPVLNVEGKAVSAFDVTEEKDAKEAAATLAKL